MAESDERDLLRAAFDLIAERGWNRFSFGDLARRSGKSLAEIYAVFPDRAAILRRIETEADRTMLAAATPDLAEAPPKDRLFELIMSRLDALQPFRAGLKALAKDLPRDPAHAALIGCNVERGLGWLIEAAGLERRSLRSFAASRALGFAYLQTIRVWLDDDSEDAAKTLAELDKRLGQIRRFIGWMSPPGRGGEPEGPATEAPEAGGA